MVKTEDKLGSAKRFGTRYGRTVKHNFAKIEAATRASTKCPFCLYKKAHRLAAGIFTCDKCHAKFASKAYVIAPIGSVMELPKESTNTYEEPEETVEETEKTEPIEATESVETEDEVETEEEVQSEE